MAPEGRRKRDFSKSLGLLHSPLGRLPIPSLELVSDRRPTVEENGHTDTGQCPTPAHDPIAQILEQQKKAVPELKASSKIGKALDAGGEQRASSSTAAPPTAGGRGGLARFPKSAREGGTEQPGRIEVVDYRMEASSGDDELRSSERKRAVQGPGRVDPALEESVLKAAN